MSQRDFSEPELEDISDLPVANRALFLEKVRQSNSACQNGDYETAVSLYTDALQLDPGNYILYSNRSAAKLKQGNFTSALQDAIKARELCPSWPKAYFRQGAALQCLGRYGDALSCFSLGISLDTSNTQLLEGFLETAIKSPLKHSLESTIQQLRNMNLDQSPFVVISVVGQELLQAGNYKSAVTVLESALRIGSNSLKLRGSVFSALSSAHWALNNLIQAIDYMQQDLAVSKSLGDTAGECRAHGNLGSAYFSQGSYKEALTAHRYQLVLAMKCKDTQAAAAALTSLGHVYTAIGDYPNALASHKQCVQLVKQIGNRLQEAREIGNVGAVYLAMGEFDLAVSCHSYHLNLAKKLGNQVEEARALSNLGSSHHYKRNFSQAIGFHEQVLEIAKQLGDKSILLSYRARAYAGLGHAARCSGDLQKAKFWHEKQLEMSLSAKDKVGEGRACSNLGIVYQLLGEYDSALKLHQCHLTIAKQLRDRAGMGRSYGNIGNAYSSAGLYEQAIKYHKLELIISKEVHDRGAEASTHGNLAVAYQAIGAFEYAKCHYIAHLSLSRELKDTVGEAVSLLNLANCLSSKQEFSQAVPYYEQYLMLSQELGDVAAEGKACHFLGYVHYCLGNYREAVRYYDQDLTLAKDLKNKMNMGRAYCNLGLAHLALGNIQASIESQKYFLAVAHMINHLPSKFRALGNIGDIFVRTGEIEESAKMYQRQLELARQARERPMEAAAYGALGLAHRLLKKFDKALGYHTQELTLRQEMADLPGECKAHAHLGHIHMALRNYTNAFKCYKEQLERSQELQDSTKEAQAYGNLGIAKLNMGHYEEAIGYLEQQLGALEQVLTPTTQHDKARALGHLGDCYDALGDFEEGIKCHERHLKLAITLQSFKDQENAYRGLGHGSRSLGNLKDALVCFEKRLVVSHELGSPKSKAAAYGDLGNIHTALGNHEQALNCLEHQKQIALDLEDKVTLSDASSALGNVYNQLGNTEEALKIHKMDLNQCENMENLSLQARACGNLGLVYEALHDYSEGIKYFEKQLSLATDKLTKAFAYASLGRVFFQIGQTRQSISFLRQGLNITQLLNKLEEEAKIRYQLGLVLLSTGETENARSQIESALQILDSIALDQRSAKVKKDHFDLQTSCYYTLKKILVSLSRNEEALVIAEQCKGRTTDGNKVGKKNAVTSFESIVETVNKCNANIIYFSLAENELYAWFLQPKKGLARFNSVKIDEISLKIESEKQESKNLNESALERYINTVRDSLGVNTDSVFQENDENNWHSSSENILEEFSNDKSGFFRMVNRNHLMNSSNYSLSSLFSLGSVGGSVASLQGSARSIGSFRGSSRVFPPWHGPTCLHALYTLLFEPFDDLIPSGGKELILVLESELYLVPFAVLRSNQESAEYLSERCSLLSVPSLQSLRNKLNFKIRSMQNKELSDVLVIGPPSRQEVGMVADMLQSKRVLASTNITKDEVISELPNAECVHFIANISWKSPAIVFRPVQQSQPNHEQQTYSSENDLNALKEGLSAGENDADFSLSSADILKIKLNARLVVLNSYQSIEPIRGLGVEKLASSWLSAGAGAVLISLWPVPETAANILLRAFYSALLQGVRASRALADAMQTVKLSKHFAHPANWAGFLLIGGNVRLSNKVALMGKALCELMSYPEKCRDALRVCLHLVEKSLQRIHRGQRNAMYTTQQSIENKAGSLSGWKDLLIAVGFRFEPAANGIQSSVFFPQSDPEERLSQCSASLQALLALTHTTLNALSKIVNNSSEVADEIIAVIRNVLSQYPPKIAADTEINIEIPLSVRLWRATGCHELLASLGFDLTEVGEDQITLKNGKQANRRNCQLTLQALLALFDTQEAPKCLGLDSTSSCESINEDIQSEKDNSTSKSLYFQRSSSPTVVKSISSVITIPPLPSNSPQILSRNSAFTSYRRRGEPDGVGNDCENIQLNSSPQIFGNLYPILDNGLANTTDSELSDGCNIPQPLYKAKCPRLGYSSLRCPVRVKVTRPGGGGESDAAFTPSPPVTQTIIDSNVSLTLAHQTRIRNLYSGSGLRDKTVPSRRPDSSSSAGSTDWEGSGHATVLRRSNQYQGLPLVESLGPLVPIYNNVEEPTPLLKLNDQGDPLESANSECEMNFSQQNIQTSFHPIFGFKGKSKIKMGGGSRYTIQPQTSDEICLMEKLSIRTEVSNVTTSSDDKRPSIIHENDNPAFFTRSSLYLAPLDTEVPSQNSEIQNLNITGPSKDIVKSNSRSIQDAILRQINREMTPTISEVYHERKMDLGLAPPLLKLLFNKNYDDSSKSECVFNKNIESPIEAKKFNYSSKISVNNKNNSKICSICNDCDDKCNCNSTILKKPWLSNVTSNIVKGSDLTTADILERQNKIKAKLDEFTVIKPNIPFVDMPKRDDGDGRSVADSQCSSTYKVDVKNLQKKWKIPTNI